VTKIYAYYKKHAYATQVMGASFRRSSRSSRLAGCDLLTIAPELLEKLTLLSGSVERMLSPEKAKKLSIEKTPLDHEAFLWQHNADAMAVEKLSDGIRKFDADARKLEPRWARSCSRARGCVIRTAIETRAGGAGRARHD
jgi:transaldolase